MSLSLSSHISFVAFSYGFKFNLNKRRKNNYFESTNDSRNEEHNEIVGVV